MKNKLEEKEKELKELEEKYIRLYSDFENYKKRSYKEKVELLNKPSKDIIMDILPILDDFERSEKTEGTNIIFNKFKSILTKKGLESIESIGRELDTDYHEAVSYIDVSDDNLKGKIVGEVEKGYKLNGNIIRYTKALIGK